MKRRQFLGSIGAAFVCWYAPPVLSLAPKNQPKLVWVLLRGAMDGLHAVIPLNDSDLFIHRKKLAEISLKNAHSLDGNFVLNSALPNLAKLYKDNELLPIVATESGAQTRSHFRAQDILESGHRFGKNDSGWLNRAVKAYHGDSLAVSHSLPISLRGDYPSQTWYPDNFIESTEDLYQRLQYLYEYDSELYESLNMGLDTKDAYLDFANNVNNIKRNLIELLTKLKREGKKVVAYGATSKSTTVTNYFDISPKLIECIYDTTPIKQNKYSPGAHIPVLPYEQFRSSDPDYVLLFAWNHAEEIMKKESDYMGNTRKWITYIPNVMVI